MLRPDRADFLVGRELTLCGFGQRGIEISSFFRREFVGRLINARELQQDSCEIVLSLIGQSGNGFNGLFEQAGHDAKIAISALLWKAGERPSKNPGPAPGVCNWALP